MVPKASFAYVCRGARLLMLEHPDVGASRACVHVELAATVRRENDAAAARRKRRRLELGDHADARTAMLDRGVTRPGRIGRDEGRAADEERDGAAQVCGAYRRIARVAGGFEGKRALVLGFGVGISSESISAHGIPVNDCVEISPAVMDAAHRFADLNGGIADRGYLDLTNQTAFARS